MAAPQVTDSIASVEAIIGYQFHDPSLLAEALQPPGYPIYFAADRSILDGNKRLAMLGDSVLQLASLEHWYFEGATRGSSGYNTLSHR